MFIHVAPALSPAEYLKAAVARPLSPPPHQQFFSHARGALITALFSMAAESGASSPAPVWIPAYACDTVAVLLDAYGIAYRFYPITRSLTPDWDALAAAPIAPGDTFVLVHFFGFPLAAAEARAFCAKRGCRLVEDAAHGIVARIVPGGVGTHGAAAVFGLRKILPVPDGGVLYSAQLEFRPPQFEPSAASISRSVPRMVAQWLLQRAGVRPSSHASAIDKTVLPQQPDHYYHFRYLQNANEWSRKILAVLDLDEVIAARRRNYQRLVDQLRQIPHFEVPNTLVLDDPQAVPLGVYAHCANSERLINALNRDGVPASAAPALHPTVFRSADWPVENAMYAEAVMLPVHQDLRDRELDAIVAAVRRHAL